MSLKGKTAIVTGAAQGIGEAVSRRLAEDGANVALADINSSLVKSVAAELTGQGLVAEAFVADVSDSSQTEQLVKNVTGRFSSLDILVNNAGITRDNLLIRTAEQDWEQVIKINLTGAFNLTKSAARVMMKQKDAHVGISVIYVPGETKQTLDIHIMSPNEDRQTKHSYGGPPKLAPTWAVNLILDLIRKLS